MADLIERDLTIHELEAFKESCIANLLRMSFDDITDVVNGIPAVNRWIPCSERLPNEAGEYLVCGRWNEEKSKTWICRFIIFGDIGWFVNSAKNPPVSFWMPMPNAYEPEKE